MRQSVAPLKLERKRYTMNSKNEILLEKAIKVLYPYPYTDKTPKECIKKCMPILYKLELNREYEYCYEGHFSYLNNLIRLQEALSLQSYIEACNVLQDIIHDDLITQPHVWYNVINTIKKFI